MKETEDVLSSLKDDGVEIETMFFQELQQPRCVSFSQRESALLETSSSLLLLSIYEGLRGAAACKVGPSVACWLGWW